MPPRFAYWTIILDGTPTSFRTKEREEILPLFNQLKAKNPSALLKWFSGGTLWDSPEQAREAREREKVRAFREQRSRDAKAQREDAEDPLAEFRRQHGRPADGSDDPSLRSLVARPEGPASRDRWSPGASPRQGPGQAAPGSPKARPNRTNQVRRGKDWRPGGEHRDPADKYKLPPGEARKRWKERNLGPRGPKPFSPKPPSSFRDGGRGFSLDGPAKPPGDRPWSGKPRAPKPFGPKPPSSFRDGGRGFSLDGPAKPPGDRPWSGKPRAPKPFRPKPPSSFRNGGRGFSLDGPAKPPGDRPWSGKPRAPKPFRPKPGGPRGKR